jgi:hypothetical protein
MDTIKITGKNITKKRSPRKARAPVDQWRNVSATQASGEGCSLSTHALASGIYLQTLILTRLQDDEIQRHYLGGEGIEDHIYLGDEDDQAAASAFLAVHNLDFESSQDYRSRWSVKWSKTTGKNGGQKRRVLYQW